MIELTRGVEGAQTDIFSVSATNLGTRPVTIRAIAIKSIFPRYDAVLMEGLPGSDPIPVTLMDGESAHWRYPEVRDDGKNWYRGFAEHFQKYNAVSRWLLLRNLRFFVATSLGNDFFAPRSSGLRSKIKTQLIELKEKT